MSVISAKQFDSNQIRIISGTSNVELAQKICEELNVPLSECVITNFANSETRIQLKASSRGKHIFIIQTGGFDSVNHKSVNDYIMEVLLIMDSVKRSGAKSITLVSPCFPYARQDKKDSSRAPISSKMVAQIFESVGLNGIVAVDLHAASIQGFFDIPCDNLYCIKPISEYLNTHVFVDSDSGTSLGYQGSSVACQLRSADFAIL